MTMVDTEDDRITKWSDDYNIRGAQEVQRVIRDDFGKPKPPSTKTIYRAISDGKLQFEKIWGAYHFSRRGIARWMDSQK